MNRLPSRERFETDPTFRTLTMTMYAFLEQHGNDITPTELREAAILAASIYEEQHIRPIRWAVSE